MNNIVKLASKIYHGTFLKILDNYWLVYTLFRIFGLSEYLELRWEHIKGTAFEDRKS